MKTQIAENSKGFLAGALMVFGGGSLHAQTEPEAAQFCCEERRPLIAAGQIIVLQLLPWSYNYYVREAEFAHVSFSSIWRNMQMGFEWDPNNFATNLFSHPYHGSQYFNAARSNGYDFWGSTAFAFGGSLLWELAAETHRPAINDWMATSVGGVSIGEPMHRIAMAVYDNEATGGERVIREIAGALINPLAGFNRLLRGEVARKGPNPSDRNTGLVDGSFDLGARVVGAGLGRPTRVSGYIEADVSYGSPFAPDHAKPFDSFELSVQINTNDTEKLGRLQSSGVLWRKFVSQSATALHVFAVNLDFDYANNAAFEIGGQSVAAGFYSAFDLGGGVSIRSRVRLNAILIGAVESEYAHVVGRKYDFGTGFAFRAGAVLNYRSHNWVTLFYDGAWLHAMNGAEGDHLVHVTGAELSVPLGRRLSAGGEIYLYSRHSYYDLVPSVHRKNPTIRLFSSFAFRARG